MVELDLKKEAQVLSMFKHVPKRVNFDASVLHEGVLGLEQPKDEDLSPNGRGP
jgi:hypothetical protein